MVKNGRKSEGACFSSINAATAPQGSITPTRSQDLNYKVTEKRLKKPFSHSILQWGTMAAERD